jgi:AcrR family transcriptional regulator
VSDAGPSHTSAGTLPRPIQAHDEPGRQGACDQRSRLEHAILTVVASDGYGGAKIGQIAARAGVSRATFYDFFQDKQACFNAAHQHLSRRAGEQIEEEISRANPARAAHAAVEAIAACAQHEPEVLSFLTHEALLAGAQARAQHDELLARLERAVEQAWDRAPQDEPAPDVPARVLLGGTVRLYCMQARRRDLPEAELLPALLRWIDCYSTPRGPRQRRTLLLKDASCTTPIDSDIKRHTSPRTLPRGRHRLGKDVVEAIQRERIAYATAEVLSEQDGPAIAVSDIVAAAGVSREVFYAHFAGKQQAFLAARQLVFEQLIAACSSAFFTPGTSWPERVWNTGRAGAGLLAANPSFAHFAFVSAYGTGELGVRCVDESALAFKVFLEEGHRQGGEAAGLPRAVLDALSLGVAELAAHHVRSGRTGELPALIPPVTYTALAPFIGPAAASELVDCKLAAERSRR